MSDQKPPEPNGNPEQPPRKLPEFIIIEESDERHYSSSASPIPPHIQIKNDQKIPFRIRLICLFLGSFVLFWCFGAFLFFAANGIVSLLFLRKQQNFNQWTAMYWKYFKTSLVVALGLFIGIFSPSLGMMLIFSYFVLQGDSRQQNMFAGILRSQFRDYM